MHNLKTLCNFDIETNKTNTIMITPNDFISVDNDKNGNPRHVCHFTNFLTDEIRTKNNLTDWYKIACKKANKIGGRKYHTKNYGGGIVFSSDNLQSLCNQINNI